MFGCCPDQLTPASGWNLLGCPGTATATTRMLTCFVYVRMRCKYAQTLVY